MYLVATRRKMSVFHAGKETWTSYSQRLGFYFSANDIEDPGLKQFILLTVCGPTTYQLLKSLLQPASPADKMYDELVQTLDNHFSPVPSPIVQHFQFNTRIRKRCVSVATYVAELKAFRENCGFGDQLNEMVQDCLVCNINNNCIKQHLLQETDLSSWDCTHRLHTSQCFTSLSPLCPCLALLHNNTKVPHFSFWMRNIHQRWNDKNWTT